MSEGAAQPATLIMNPAHLGPVDSVDFCGACHRTSVDVVLTGAKGIQTLRFPAYRLQRSRCWGKGDARITCIACHDPHLPLVTDVATYDRNCLNCHMRSAASTPMHLQRARACPVGQKNCVTCHMPKRDVQEMHGAFTDHRIAVYRPGAAFQD
jgi:formate-dependent nitrite reductase cytochrome c552 subunit